MHYNIPRKLLTVIAAVLALVFAQGIIPGGSAAQDKAQQTSAPGEKEQRSIRIGKWLLLGPISEPFPAFKDEESEDNDVAFLLSSRDIRIEGLAPAEGISQNLIGGTIAWTAAEADSGGIILPSAYPVPQAYYLVSYIDVPRWMKIEADVRSSQPFELFIDGRSIAKSTSSTGSWKDIAKQTGKTSLDQGKHLMLVKTVMVPADTAMEWRIDACLRAAEGFKEDPVATLDPVCDINISHILDFPNVSAIDISPDGTLVLISYWRFIPPDGERESWFEIRHLPGGGLERTIRESSMSAVQWAPGGKKLSYISRGQGKGSIISIDLETGASSTILADIPDLSRYKWSPDGTYIVYYTDKEEPKSTTGIKRLRSIIDRSGDLDSKTSTFIASVPEGITRKLTTGKYETFVQDISPDGRRLLVLRSYEELSERPYTANEIHILDLDDMSTRLLCEGGWLGEARWSPDGKKVLLSGGPSAFGDKGLRVSGGRIPNDYDGQLYIMDIATGSVEAITRDFDPAVTDFIWSRDDGNIYFTAESGEFVKLFRCDPGKRSFKEIAAGSEVIGSWDICLYKPVAVVVASGSRMPEKLYHINLKNGKSAEIAFPGESILKNIRFGNVEDFNFTSEKGVEIKGHVYYPSDFDPAKKYPCIVYYYGGTSPVDRRFGGRWPKNLWAAKGYVVYILQPTGATGFGQDFSTGHVNDWGKMTVEEIIYGTKKFLEAHPFVNPYRVGCMGASYGGFMTQLLITRTDMFAAAVSHAGISMIPSYWGEGYWGYRYNAVAAAESFPWNRRDIYVDQSPLFSADKINTPLLLLHGAVDTNVPPGESEQMYTALKLLGREVEYIKYSEQDHFILDYKKRKSWSDAQMAWFDKWLKDQPEWWDDSYPPLDGGAKAEPKKMKAARIELDEGNVILIGDVTREDIIREHVDWDREYFEYTPDAALIPQIAENLMDVEITCVLGTWCSDSQREIPRLWKILEEAGYPAEEISMYAVGSSRLTVESPVPVLVYKWSKDVRAHFAIERVATIILSRGGKELGRIVETPEESLEIDLAKILAAK